MSKEPHPQKLKVTVEVAKDAFDIMEKLRGRLTQDSFIELILRMIDSNAVSRPPGRDVFGPSSLES